jgi:hypothetical protein
VLSARRFLGWAGQPNAPFPPHLADTKPAHPRPGQAQSSASIHIGSGIAGRQYRMAAAWGSGAQGVWGMSQSSSFERIFTSAPLNKTAALVTGKGVHFDDTAKLKRNPGHRHFEAPPVCVDPKDYPQAPEFQDLRGRKIGRMKVVGYLGTLGYSKWAKGAWLVRCVCGDYETRKAKTIKTSNDPNHSCDRCAYTNRLVNGYRGTAVKRGEAV